MFISDETTWKHPYDSAVSCEEQFAEDFDW